MHAWERGIDRRKRYQGRKKAPKRNIAMIPYWDTRTKMYSIHIKGINTTALKHLRKPQELRRQTRVAGLVFPLILHFFQPFLR